MAEKIASDLNPILPSQSITDIRQKADLDPKQPLNHENLENGGLTGYGRLDAVKPGQKTGSI